MTFHVPPCNGRIVTLNEVKGLLCAISEKLVIFKLQITDHCLLIAILISVYPYAILILLFFNYAKMAFFNCLGNYIPTITV